jgi:hypothetical protein
MNEDKVLYEVTCKWKELIETEKDTKLKKVTSKFVVIAKSYAVAEDLICRKFGDMEDFNIDKIVESKIADIFEV